ncbi:MAG: integrin alpha, partial [Candidatus Thermoplasmatota archaeon]|nr:integrin alpha [Candidatus Thermoplasmatota archaeon]
MDGDDVIDIVVGSPRDDESSGSPNRGAVWILFLNSNGTVKSEQKIGAGYGGFSGHLDIFDEFGCSVSNISDLNGDGIIDVAVGAHWDDDGAYDQGAVWILFLNTDGTVKSHQKISSQKGNFTGTLIRYDLFGESVSNVGDLNGDGITDLAVGSKGDDDGGGWGRGAVWLLFLNNDGTVKSHINISDTNGGFDGDMDDDDYFGFSISRMGDLNGDGIMDLAIGARGDGDGGINRGAVWILFLNDKPNFGTIWNSTLTTGDVALFSVNITDFFGGVNEVSLNYTINSNINYNWSITNQTDDSWLIYITLPNDAKSFEYFFWANDTGAYSNTTNNNTLNVRDNDNPELVADNSRKIGTTGDIFLLNISASDNIEIATVHVNWSHANYGGNISMTLSDSNWICEILLDHNLTDLVYILYINDTTDNYAISSKFSTIVVDNDRPFLEADYSQKIGTTGDKFELNISAFDNIAVDSVEIYWSHGYLGGNFSLSRNGSYWIGNVILDHEIKPLSYFIIIKDTSGNYNISDRIIIVVSDNDDPKYIEDLTRGNPTTGDEFTFKVAVKDNIVVHQVLLRYSFDDSVFFEVKMILEEEHYSKEIDIPNNAVMVKYSFNISDTAGNWQNESRLLINVIDNDISEFLDLTIGSATTGEKFNISVRVLDNIGVDSVYIQYNFDDGSEHNETMIIL